MKFVISLKQVIVATTLTVAPLFAFAGGTGPGGGSFTDFEVPPFLVWNDQASDEDGVKQILDLIAKDLRLPEISSQPFALKSEVFESTIKEIKITWLESDFLTSGELKVFDTKTARNFPAKKEIVVNSLLWANAANGVQLTSLLNRDFITMNASSIALRKALLYHEVLAILGFENDSQIPNQSTYPMSAEYYRYLTADLIRRNPGETYVSSENFVFNSRGIYFTAAASPEITKVIIKRFLVANQDREYFIGKKGTFGLFVAPQLIEAKNSNEVLQSLVNKHGALRRSQIWGYRTIGVPALKYLPSDFNSLLDETRNLRGDDKPGLVFFQFTEDSLKAYEWAPAYQADIRIYVETTMGKLFRRLQP